MATAFVQGTGLQSTGSVASLAKAFTSNVTAGNLIAVGIIGNRATAPTFTGTPPSDGALGNTYSQRVTFAGGNPNTRVDGWRAKNINGGACTVTVTPNAAATVSIGIAEVSGADTVSPDGNTGTGTGTSTTPATGSVVIATAGEILFGIMTQDGAASTLTKGATFTEVFNDPDVTEMPVEFEYKVTSADSTANWTQTGATQWECVAFAFKAAAGATTTDLAIWPAQTPNRFVGPMALRLTRHSPVPYDLTQAPATDTNFSPLVRVPNNRVGPPVLRALYRAPSFMFDTTRIAVSGNRIRRVICSSSDA